ncbi:MAG: radical SAM/SPASM domain-containing protein [Candidatus Woesearchaeota archaeon]
MNIIDQFIFSYSRNIPNKIIDYLNKLYMIVHKIKCFILYKNTDMFNYITIELDRNCNRKCNYCPKSIYKDNGKISFFNKNNFLNLIKQLKKINYKGRVILSGYCEPLMNENLKEFILIIKKNLPKVKIIIYTNGDYINNKFSNFLKNNLINLIVTFHKPNSTNNIKNIRNKFINYNRVIFRKNFENSYLSTRGGIVSIKKKEIKKICITPLVNLTIDYKGNVIICSHDFFSNNSFGNLKNKNIIDIWNLKKYKLIRKNLSKGIFKNEICKYCTKK